MAKYRIELDENEIVAALEALQSARDDDCSPVSTLARVFDAINRARFTFHPLGRDER